jgi:hypothetical protein
MINNMYTPQIINTMITFGLVAICSIGSYFIFKRKMTNKRKLTQLKSRISYIGIIFFLTVMIRIWIEGFSHLFTMLSLVAAGLVVTNKESIMNLTGWLIIKWRGLFSEKDYVQINGISGYIAEIHLFYFKLYETTALASGRATGKVIKIPNSFVITTPMMLYTDANNLHLNEIELTFNHSIDLSLMIQKVEQITQAVVNKWYEKDLSFSTDHLKRKNHALATIVDQKPQITVNTLSGEIEKIAMNVSFYCHRKDAEAMKTELLALLYSQSKQPEKINDGSEDQQTISDSLSLTDVS